MKLATPEQMREIDRLTIEGIGIPGMVLMENAAVHIVDEAVELVGTFIGKNILVFAGKGNNGGDAYAAARHLFNKGAGVRVLMTSKASELQGDALNNFMILQKMGLEVAEIKSQKQVEELALELDRADLILDGIFGTGLKGEIKGIIKDLIVAVNQSGKPVLSIDIPSGVDGETGKICGICIQANKTVTLGLPKIGLAIHPGCEYTGKLVVVDIGIPRQVIEEVNPKADLILGTDVANLIPSRRRDTNKGNYGKLFIVSGSVGMTGAGALMAASALRTGAGLVYLGVPETLASIYEAALREAVTVPLDDQGRGRLSIKSLEQILIRMKNSDVTAVGPGLSLDDEIVDIMDNILEKAEVPLVVDADALNALAKNIGVLKKIKVPVILTPHPGEMARMMGITVEQVQNNRIETAREFSNRWNVITVLKGARTVVALPDQRIFINTTGNPGMATGGTGDVLTGVIASLAGQGVKPAEAAVAGVYIHGLAGDQAAMDKGEHGLIAGDLVEELPRVIKKMYCKANCEIMNQQKGSV